MKPIAPTPTLLIATAGAFIGLREEPVRGEPNRGLLIDQFLRETGHDPGAPWCAAFVYHVGYWSHYDHANRRSWWPLPSTASCYVLGEFARMRGVLFPEPRAGDVFLVFNPMLNRFAHTGVVVRVLETEARSEGRTWYTCLTIEGNTNAEGSREGNAVVRKTRRFHPEVGDRFVRWVELAERAKVANV